MNNYVLFIPALISFFVTLFLIPNWIKRAKKAKIVGKDIHKIEKTEVAEAGGVTVIAGFSLGALSYIAINTFIIGSTNKFIEIFALMLTIILISFIAFIDDIVGWKIGLRKKTRIILVLFATIPLIAINAGKSIITIPFIGLIDLGIAYPLILIPIGILGATTTYNFLAGFNGLETGLGIIVLTGLSIVSYLLGNVWLFEISLIMVAALIAFLIFNYCPAKILPGDSLTYPIGGLIAIMSILGDFERIAVFFFIPFIIEFFLKLRGKLVKESFAKIDKAGNLDLRYDKIYGLTHLSMFLMKKFGIKPTERKVTLSIWVFQIIIIILGFILFREALFR